MPRRSVSLGGTEAGPGDDAHNTLPPSRNTTVPAVVAIPDRRIKSLRFMASMVEPLCDQISRAGIVKIVPLGS
jgi:hypothetical protein